MIFREHKKQIHNQTHYSKIVEKFKSISAAAFKIFLIITFKITVKNKTKQKTGICLYPGVKW